MSTIPANASERVVVTGIGVISPLGHSLAQFWNSVSNGVSGLIQVTSMDTTGYGSNLGGEVTNFAFDQVKVPNGVKPDRTVVFALAAANQAVQLAGLPATDYDHERFGVVLGTCMGGMRSGEEWHRQWITRGYEQADHALLLGYQFYAASDAVSAAFGLHGPKATISTACAAGANAIGYAFDLIRHGKADRMLAGGSESLAHIAYAGFSSLQSLTPDFCSPYSSGRRGLNLGEGAGIVVLERLDLALARGATVYAEIMGYGLSIDGYHPTAPHPQGLGAARAVGAALKAGGITRDQVSYINGHGTGTPKNDSAETNAIKASFGERARSIPVSSTKSMVGHSLGAAGAIEGITTMLAIHNQYIPPTINYQAQDPELDLDYVPNQGRSSSIEVAISNSFAFGGNNAVVVYGRFQPEKKLPVVKTDRVVVTGIGLISSAGLGKQAFWEAVKTGRSCVGPIASFDASEFGQSVAGDIPAFDMKQFIPAKDMRRMDLSTKYAIISSKMALADAGFEVNDANRTRVGIIAGTGNGPAQAATSFHRPMVEDGPTAANPAIFPNTVFNAAAGQVAIHLHLQGVTSTLTSERASGANAITYGYDLLRQGLNDAIICLGFEEFEASSMAAYSGLGLTAPVARPFDADRNGFAPSGGAVALVLETLESATTRGAHIYGEMVGYGMTSDAVPTGQHDITGRQVARAMQIALQEGGVRPDQLGYICASANGNRAGDLTEARGISLALGEAAPKVPVSTYKGTTGEPMGCSGGMGVVTGLMALEDYLLPPSVGLEKPGPGCKLCHVSKEPLEAYIENFMVNAVACGGNNVSLLFKRYGK